jgi:2-oxoglutarate ferredoxin oxidoreductase subunit gamma
MTRAKEIRLSGTGGQGLILAGIILAEAAIIDNKNAIQSQSYGPEARGGASKSEVIISSEEIYYPKVTKPDIFLALSQEAYQKYIKGIKDNAAIIIDSSISTDDNLTASTVKIPILDTASDKLGKPMVANIVALGAIVGLTGIVSESSIEKAVLSRVPSGTGELNKKALLEGYELVSNYSLK